MTPQQLQEIRDRWAKATQGPWEVNMGEYCAYVLPAENPESVAMVRTTTDAAAIASAPTDIANLLAEVERLNEIIGNTFGPDALRKYFEQEAGK